jgi:hypothetical protein
MGRGQSTAPWQRERVRFDRTNATPNDPHTPPPADGDPEPRRRFYEQSQFENTMPCRYTDETNPRSAPCP